MAKYERVSTLENSVNCNNEAKQHLQIRKYKGIAMDKFFQKFLRIGVSLAPLGIETREDNAAYFCTPKGATIIGWAGADGIHYCRVHGFGNMIFAVSPMNSAPYYVHPIAEDFETLLRLLLVCGDAAALEQAWQWNEEQLSAFLTENPPTDEMKTLISEIGRKLNLSPIENPWQYLHSLQESFDYSKIKYTEDIADPDMNANAEFVAPEWKVYFDGNFWRHHGKDRAGTEICIGKEFEWAEHHWLIPAAYSCGKGLVIDFCMRVEPDKICSFMKKWNLNAENDSCDHFTKEQQMELDMDNPLYLNFIPRLELNGKEMQSSHSCAVTYNPCLPDGVVNELEAKWAIGHYGLDAAYGWVICRSAFPWIRKRRPEIQTLSLTMEQQRSPIPGPHFKIYAPGDSFSFVHPVSRTEYTLTVHELEQQTLPANSFHSDRWFYPTHFTAMSYTLLPETSASITISDCDEGDNPLETSLSDDLFLPSSVNDAACIGIIGGADGPTSLVFGGSKQRKLCTACSSLHFEPAQHDIEWRITFHEKRFENFSMMLIKK